MTLSRNFRETIQSRTQSDPAFAQAMFQEGVQALLDGDLDVGRSVLRDYINATVGFEDLANGTGTSAKSLMRMFSQSGNPQAKNIFGVIAYLQGCTGMQLEVRAANG